METANLALAILWAIGLFSVSLLALFAWIVSINAAFREDAELVAVLLTVVAGGSILWTLSKAGMVDVGAWL